MVIAGASGTGEGVNRDGGGNGEGNGEGDASYTGAGPAAGAEAAGAFQSKPAKVGVAAASTTAKTPAVKIVFRPRLIAAIVPDPAPSRIPRLK